MFGIIKIKEFAKELGVPESTVRTWRRRCDIPSSCFKNIGGSVFVKVDEMKNWLSQKDDI